MVYVNLLDQKEPKLNLESAESVDPKFNANFSKKNNISKKIIKPNNKELQLHKEYLKSYLSKNYYN